MIVISDEFIISVFEWCCEHIGKYNTSESSGTVLYGTGWKITSPRAFYSNVYIENNEKRIQFILQFSDYLISN